jgi:hypothetical protein
MKSLIDNLPPEVIDAHAALEGALAQRADLLRRQTADAAEEPAAVRMAEVASAEHEQAEIDLALATDENFAILTKAREKLAASAAEARTALDTLHRRQRGIAAKLAETDAAIEAAYAEWSAASASFLAELRLLYQRHVAKAAAALVRALRMGYALHDALPLGGLRGSLDAIIIPDVAPRPGRPFPYVIKGPRAWLDDDVDLAGDDLRIFDHDHPEIAALHDMLKPLGQAERAAASLVRTIQTKRARDAETARLSSPRERLNTPREAENSRVMAMSDEEFRAHRAAVANASRIYPPFDPNKHTYSGGGFASSPARRGGV